MQKNTNTVNPIVRLIGSLFGYEPKAASAMEAAADAASAAVSVVETEASVSVSFQVQKAWNKVNGSDHSMVGLLGGGATNKPGAAFISAWAVAIGGDPSAAIGSFACNGRGKHQGLPTQIGFNAELSSAEFRAIKEAVKAAEAAGKTRLQLLVTGVTEVFAAEGSKYYDEGLGGTFAVNPIRGAVVLKSRLRLATFKVVGEGDLGWVRLASEREVLDLKPLLESAADKAAANRASAAERAMAAITALYERSAMEAAAPVVAAVAPLSLEVAADAAAAQAEEDNSHLWD